MQRWKCLARLSLGHNPDEYQPAAFSIDVPGNFTTRTTRERLDYPTLSFSVQIRDSAVEDQGLALRGGKRVLHSVINLSVRFETRREFVFHSHPLAHALPQDATLF